jgi:hypothetical protein
VSERTRGKKRGRWFRLGGVGAVAIAGVAGLFLVNTLNQPGWDLAPASQTRPIPPQQISGLVPAAQAAGCQLRNYRSTALDHYHAPIGARLVYKSSPPSFGVHYPYPALDGDYVGIGAPRAPFLVHALEHGRIEIQYRPGVSQYHVDQLQELFNQSDGAYGPGAYLLLVANNSRMPYTVAAVAWGHVMGCPTINNRIFDAMRAFRRAFTLKASEHAIGPE